MENTNIRIAKFGITDELRNMEVGDIVRFPVDKYNFNTVRSTPAGSLVAERMNEGRRWKSHVNYDEKCIEVTRVS